MVAADAAAPQPRPATGQSSGNPGHRERRALRTRAHAPGQGLAYTRPRAPLLWPLPGEHRGRQAKIPAPSLLARMLVQTRLQNKDRAESLGSEAAEQPAWKTAGSGILPRELGIRKPLGFYAMRQHMQ